MKSKIFMVLILFACSAFFMADFLQAQPGRGQQPPPMMPDSTRIKQMVTELDQALTLTKEQKEKVTLLYTNHFAEMKKTREKQSGDRESMRKSREEMRTKLDQEIKTLLDTTQKEKFEKFIQERSSRRERPDRRPPR